jgi:NAD(P)H-dependent flavin oxidoreductase YrpB (nitropropane dioxygenase family)
MEAQGAALEELAPVISGENTKKMFEEDGLDQGLLPCGQGVGLVGKIQPVQEIIAEIMREAAEVQERLKKMQNGSR